MNSLCRASDTDRRPRFEKVANQLNATAIIIDIDDSSPPAAIELLLHNLRGPHRKLPRTAGWGHPEPYTRDLLIASLGMLLSREPIRKSDHVK
jgi:hypothetical protein